MKPKTTIILTGFCIFQSVLFNQQCGSLYAQCDYWTQKTNLPGASRDGAVGFAIGNKGYFGTGFDGNYKKDFWEYDPATDTWTQLADLTGPARTRAVGFSIGERGYIGTGAMTGAVNLDDFWEYDTTANSWAPMDSFAGTARYEAVGFSIGNKGYIGTGHDGAYTRDFWAYDPLGDSWTPVDSLPGSARSGAAAFVINDQGYVGTGRGSGFFSDFWKYDPVGNTWTAIASLTGAGRQYAAGFAIGDKGYLATGWTSPSTFYDEFLEYDAVANTWTLKSIWSPNPYRYRATGFTIADKGYVCAGKYQTGTYYKTLWEYTPDVSADAGSDTIIDCMINSVTLGATSAASGGTAPYTYAWSPGTTLDDSTIANPAAFPQETTAYTLTVTDANGCTDTNGVTLIVTTVPTPICVITVDNTAGKNLIVWEKAGGPSSIDSFKVYRNIIGTYTLIGTHAYADLSEFTDSTPGVDPKVTSYSYKISVVDTCGFESVMSDLHKTIHLQISPGVGNDINLDWDDYLGFSVSYYRVLRDSTGLDLWEQVDSFAFGTNSFTDLNPPQTPDLRYVIEVVTPVTCTSSKMGKDYNTSRSNTQMSADTTQAALSVTTIFTNTGSGPCTGTATATATGGYPPYTYQWLDPGFQATQTATGLCAGSYSVIVSDTSGDSDTATVTIGVTGIEDFQAAGVEVMVYPNPSTGSFVIMVSAQMQMDAQLKIFNILGEEVINKSLHLQNGANESDIDLAQQGKGIYYVQLFTKFAISNQKIVVE